MEGLRVKHAVGSNSVKMYDKQGCVLRVETTINDAWDIKVYRPKEGDSGGGKGWRYLRKGVADLYRRAQFSQSANERYLAALGTAEDKTPLRDLGPMRAARAEDLRGLGITDRRFGWPLEMVLLASSAGWRLAEVTVPYSPRTGRSKVTGTVRGTVRAVRDMGRVLR